MPRYLAIKNVTLWSNQRLRYLTQRVMDPGIHCRQDGAFWVQRFACKELQIALQKIRDQIPRLSVHVLFMFLSGPRPNRCRKDMSVFLWDAHRWNEVGTLNLNWLPHMLMYIFVLFVCSAGVWSLKNITTHNDTNSTPQSCVLQLTNQFRASLCLLHLAP